MAVTEKELRKLNRKQLLELLLEQSKRVDVLEKQLAAAEARLNERIILEAEAGSIAEASLRLNGVFEAAQAAADQYLESVKYIAQIRQKRDGEDK